MLLKIILRQDHMSEGKISSTNEDPLSLAIKEFLRDYTPPRDIVAVGDNEIYLDYKGEKWIAKYDIAKLYRTTEDKSRTVKLDFKPYDLHGVS